MTKHRDSSLYGTPPSGMKNPIGCWYCDECKCIGAECEAKGSHIWKIKWMEETSG